MPLRYDDIPGSWGDYSTHWPKLVFETSDAANRAYIACTKGNVVPYGCYVLNNDEKYPRQWKNGAPTIELRLENQAWLDKLTQYLDESPHETYEALREHFIETGRW